MTRGAVRHARRFEKGEDGEFTVSCSCRTFVRTRVATWSEAAADIGRHLQAVADGTWQTEQNAQAARLAALAPLHAAIRAESDAVDEARSAAFAVIIARQHGGDVERARADLVEAVAARDAATAARIAIEAAVPAQTSRTRVAP